MKDRFVEIHESLLAINSKLQDMMTQLNDKLPTQLEQVQKDDTTKTLAALNQKLAENIRDKCAAIDKKLSTSTTR